MVIFGINAVLEALGHGIPVLASDIPEHREILPAEDLLPLNDPAAWVAAIRDLCKPDPAPWLDLVARQQRAADRLRFDWDAAVRHCILSDNAIPASRS